MYRLFLIFILAIAATNATAQDADSLPKQRGDVITRLLNYFNDANKNKNQRKFDFSVIGGPHYDSDTKLGLGLVAAGLYRTCRTDTLLPPSNVSLFGDVSSVGFWLLGIRGTNIARGDRYRIDYTTYFYSFPSKYWGIGYANGDDATNETKFKRWQARVQAAFLIRICKGLYAGPLLAFELINGRHIDMPEMLDGQAMTTHSYGVGGTVQLDTRDNLTCPTRGVYARVQQICRPLGLWNPYAFSTTDIQADTYVRPWRGCVLGFDARAQFNYGNPPWGMMAKLGGSSIMRGYYEGRYRDKHKAEAQAELRQHVWKRNGIVAWAGCGTVFGREAFAWRRVLPSYGLGYRWEFKKNVNVRLDYGFGKEGNKAFMFGINEAF